MGRKRVLPNQFIELFSTEADTVHIPMPGSAEELAALAQHERDRNRPDRPPRPRPRQNGAAGVPPGAPHQQRQPPQGRQHVASQAAHGQPGPSIALNRGRFVEWSPTEVTSGAATADATAIAIARASGDIEIWDSLNWNCLKVTAWLHRPHPPRVVAAAHLLANSTLRATR